ncbi:hypothetical protein DPEC_G00320610 [Dallia pectoralis]|uniref:Uncharacterized protein n=1 Tax=Dallia pectoralis TaxID=75939 RepID=A0ACC2F9Q3_DALPE|nr:hypothetical protein DPEC_G00320610 [Dallia pectoralis]
MTRQESLFLLVPLLCTVILVQGGCPRSYPCPDSPPACPPGISQVTDSCGGCKVCARQYNQDCSDSKPCDHIKGLRCHLGAGGNPETGLCRAEIMGRPCELGGRVYQHGEDFQPSCQHQCSCMDGVVGCMPLCPHQVPVSDWRCSRPRLVRLPGRCCEEWLCDDDNRVEEDSRVAVRASPPLSPRHPDVGSNELLAAPTPWDSSAGTPQQEWISSPQSHAILPSSCFQQTTDWSSCSATCGMGVSSRVTNSNAECRLARETRLCQIRQCDRGLGSSSENGKTCQRTIRPRKAVRITFLGCSTARRYRPRSCGSCADGRCCAPSVTRTVRLRFRCPDGRQDFTRSVMWIQRCRCGQSCQSLGSDSMEFLSLPNDIHTFTH